MTNAPAPGAAGALGTLSAHTLVYLAGSLAAKVAAFLLLPILTRYLTPADYGVLELTDATLSLLLQLVGFQLDAALVRFYLDEAPGRARDRVVSTAFISLGLLACAAGLVLVVLAPWLADALLKRPDLPEAVRLVGVILVAMVLTEIPISALKAERRSMLVTGWLLARLLAELGAKILFVVAFSMGVLGVLRGQAVAAALFVVGFAAWLVRRFGAAFDRKALRAMFAFSAPMAVAGLCQFALHSADRYMLRWLSTMSELGLYGIGYRFGYAVTGVALSAFLLIWFPYVFSLKGEVERRPVLSAAAVHVPAALLAGSLPIGLFAPEIVALFTDARYHASWVYVPVVLFAYLFWGAFQVFQTPFYVHKQTRRLPWLVGGAALLNVAANFAVIPRFGAMGAALATVVALAALCVVIHAAARKLEEVPVPWRRLGALLAVCAVAAVACYALDPDDPRSLWLRGGACVLLLAYLAGPFLTRHERAALADLARPLLGALGLRRGGGAR